MMQLGKFPSIQIVAPLVRQLKNPSVFQTFVNYGVTFHSPALRFGLCWYRVVPSELSATSDSHSSLKQDQSFTQNPRQDHHSQHTQYQTVSQERCSISTAYKYYRPPQQERYPISIAYKYYRPPQQERYPISSAYEYYRPPQQERYPISTTYEYYRPPQQEHYPISTAYEYYRPAPQERPDTSIARRAMTTPAQHPKV